MKKCLIYLVGVDGAGKTTLSQKLVKKFSNNRTRLGYLYLRHFPFLLYPLKFFGKKSILKDTDEFKNYKNYHIKKTSFFTNHRFLAKLYIILWLFDYLVITYFRMIPYLISSKPFIVDRYYLDQIVNISDSVGISITDMEKYRRFLDRILPNPSLIIYLEIDPKLAFSRKNDIQSVEYLESKINKYALLLNNSKMQLDASLAPDLLLIEASAIIREFLEKK